MKRILAADIGGTNSRFASFTLKRNLISHDRSIWLSTSAADSFEHLLDLLAQSNFELQPKDADIIVFAVAGPVIDGFKCSPPNISWDIDLNDVPKEYGCEHALLMNDFLAQGYAALTPLFDDAIEVIAGTAIQHTPIAILGAGTGLGKSLLIPDGAGNYIPIPSEGGHGFFPFTTKEEIEYADFLRKKTGAHKIITDMVLSGSGLEHLYEFHTGDIAPSHKIVSHFHDYPDVLKWFARFYGRACHNFVLDTFALGGLFLTGGITAGNPILVQNEDFEKSFRDCELYSNMLCNVPIKLNENEEAGLWGAAQYGADRLKHKPRPHPTR